MSLAVRVKVASNGRMVLPRELRDRLGVTGGGSIFAALEGEEVKLTSLERSLAHAQALCRQFTTTPFTTDDFLAERQKEAERENNKFKAH